VRTATLQSVRAGRLPGRANPVNFAPGRQRPAAAARSGPTTPMLMTYFSASSTLMRSASTSARGIMRKKPEVGLGVVGTYTLT
jgi:hypothetical protein